MLNTHICPVLNFQLSDKALLCTRTLSTTIHSCHPIICFMSRMTVQESDVQMTLVKIHSPAWIPRVQPTQIVTRSCILRPAVSQESIIGKLLLLVFFCNSSTNCVLNTASTLRDCISLETRDVGITIGKRCCDMT